MRRQHGQFCFSYWEVKWGILSPLKLDKVAGVVADPPDGTPPPLIMTQFQIKGGGLVQGVKKLIKKISA